MDRDLGLRPSERYELRELIGEGGMGQVHRAWDRDLDRFVALKFIRGGDASLAQRLIVEARLQGSIDHPHIAKIYEVGLLEGEPFIAMQLVKGQSLDELSRGLPLRTRVELLIQVAGAVQAAHQMGLVHRDLKPGNILVEPTPDGRLHPYLTDFGLARGAEATGLTSLGIAAGTLPYMSPEQASGEAPVDFRSDIYGLGATLFALLTGHPPFESRHAAEEESHPGGDGDSASMPSGLLGGWRSRIRRAGRHEPPFSLLRRVLDEDPPAPSQLQRGLDRDLDIIVLKCLEKSPHRRYASAQALAEDLQRWLDGQPILARRTGRLERGVKWLLRHRAAARTAAVASLLLLVAVAGWVRAIWRAGAQAEVALRMGSEAKTLEAELRAAYLLPAHDVRPDKARVRAALQRLQEELARAGGSAGRAGAFALGCGHLALGDLDEARADLERAWNEGYRAPEVALALGRVYARLYRRDRGRLVQQVDPVQQERSLEALNRQWRDPALQLLRGLPQVPPEEQASLEGFLALTENRFDNGLAAARAIQSLSPGTYEGLMLEGNIHLFQAEELIHHGRIERGLPLLDQAQSDFARALEIGRSDPALYHMASLCRYERCLALGSQRGPRPEDFEEPLRAADMALRVDPDSAGTLLMKSDIVMKKAYTLNADGRPEPSMLEEAIALAEKAIRLDPANAFGWEELAQAIEHQIWLRGDLDFDVKDLCDQALAASDKALALAGASPSSNYLRASLLSELAANELKRRGADPRPEVALAEAGYLKVTELGQDRASVLLARSRAWKTVAQYEMTYGLDPDTTARLITGLYEKGLRTWPEVVQLAKEDAVWQATWAEWQLDHGQDPGAALKDGLAAAEGAHAIDARDSILEATLMRLHTVAGRWRAAHGQDPGSAFAAAVAAGYRSRQLNVLDPDFWLALGRLHAARARWALRSGSGPEPELRDALEALREGIRVDPRSCDFFLLSAEVQQLRAEALRRAGQPPRPALEAAGAALAEARRLAPFRPDLEREEARLKAGPLHAG
ncbi:MAG TPA: protein kinase [Holophagaceae bacterium]|nr:protein kinase [Holophagaceae bacterium]